MTLTPYHAKYFAWELTKRSSSDNLQKFASVLVDAQVDLNPHQVEAALFAFHSPLSMGAILADEVGLGKTIEAGLVISQKWAERKRKVLIITPASLRKQWSQELQDKFFLPSVILESKTFNGFIKAGNLQPFDQDEIILCSYQFARTKEAYIRRIHWDLVVIDEAHRLRNVYKTSNKIARSIKESLESTPKILLTATPLQNSLAELYGLVSIIDEYAFGDLKSYKAQYSRIESSADDSQFKELKERIKPVIKRTLRRQVQEYIRFTKRIALVEEFYPTAEEQKLYDLVSDYLQRDTLYALPSSQRKLMTLILRKLLASSTYAISGTLEGLVVKLENVIAEKNSDGMEKAVAEDFEPYEDMKDEWEEESEPEPEKEKKQYTSAEIESVKKEINNLKEFERLAKSIRKNSKGEKLFTALTNGFRELDRLGAQKKAIIFTESRRTQEYLKDILENRGYAGRVVLFNGTNTDKDSKEIYKNWNEKYKDTDKITGSRTADMRAALVDFFREEATIMIATEAASEGINLQFCSLVINYDLPWNPQRIEQRIGRCHRYGQKYDVVVVNFLNKANAADQRVYELLRDKFQLFSGVFGASDEVLGSIESGVDFEKRIATIYQECRTPEQIDIAFNELQHELDANIANTLQKTRKELLENFDEEVHEKLRLDKQESEIYLSKYEDWLWCISKYFLEHAATFSEDGYSFMLNRNPFPGSIIPPGPYRIGRNIDDAHIYRIGHPLAQRIISHCKEEKLLPATLSFNYSGTPVKISILEDLVGKNGWLMAQSITITALEEEDFILFAGVTDDGILLDTEQCSRLFSLNAEPQDIPFDMPEDVRSELNNSLQRYRQEILDKVGARNGHYFEMELEKLDNWGEDKRNSLKTSLAELDDQIKVLKKEARLAPNLPEKLKIEKERKRLESERDNAWREYDGAAKEIEQSKDQLLDRIEQRLKQQLKEEKLFLIKWEIS